MPHLLTLTSLSRIMMFRNKMPSANCRHCPHTMRRRLFSSVLLSPHGLLPVKKRNALCCPDFPLVPLRFCNIHRQGQALHPKQTNMKNDVYKRRTVRLHPDDTFFCNTVKRHGTNIWEMPITYFFRCLKHCKIMKFHTEKSAITK